MSESDYIKVACAQCKNRPPQVKAQMRATVRNNLAHDGETRKRLGLDMDEEALREVSRRAAANECRCAVS